MRKILNHDIPSLGKENTSQKNQLFNIFLFPKSTGTFETEIDNSTNSGLYDSAATW